MLHDAFRRVSVLAFVFVGGCTCRIASPPPIDPATEPAPAPIVPVAVEPDGAVEPITVKDAVTATWHLRHGLEASENLLAFLEPVASEADRQSIDDTTRRVTDLRDDLVAQRASITERFVRELTSVPLVSPKPIRVAVRHKPFLDQTPLGLTIESEEGVVTIRKRPGGETLHVCPDPILGEDGDAIVRFRLTVRGGGGTPVPYFGVRDEQGQEDVLVLFSTYPDPEHEFEILLRRRGSDLITLRDGDVVERAKARNVDGPVRLFFHMNDTSEIVIHEFGIASRGPTS